MSSSGSRADRHPEVKADQAHGSIEAVISGGFCIGCGACAVRAPAALTMAPGRFGMPIAVVQPSATSAELRQAVEVCPFGDGVDDEDTLGLRLFGSDRPAHPQLGHALSTFAARVSELDFRETGSSGGLGSWLPMELLRVGLVDAVIHVKPVPVDRETEGPLFSYTISETTGGVRAGAKSRYHPVSLDLVIEEIRKSDKRFVLVGVPCFVKAVRLLALHDPDIQKRLKFCVGLVCGHLKTRRFAELLAWQMGVAPPDLASFDFRKKLSGADANRYGVAATGFNVNSGVELQAPVRELFGYDWGMGFFKPKACDYCDDVVAELADVTVGDAWLPQYLQDSGGTNVVIVRNPILADLLDAAVTQGRIWRESLSPDEVVQSQAGGFSHRREGLAYRLHVAIRKGKWVPRKRVSPKSFDDSPDFRLKHDLRMAMARESHLAFAEARQAGDLKVFFRRMQPLVDRYRDLGRSPWRRVAARLRGFLFRKK